MLYLALFDSYPLPSVSYFRRFLAFRSCVRYRIYKPGTSRGGERQCGSTLLIILGMRGKQVLLPRMQGTVISEAVGRYAGHAILQPLYGTWVTAWNTAPDADVG